MGEIQHRVLLVSDGHHQTVDFYKQKGQDKSGIFFVTRVYDLWKKNNNKNIKSFFNRIKEGKYSFMIDLGDFCECLYSERGLVTENDIEIIKDFKNKREIKLEFDELYYIPGNHDLGYISEISRDDHGGISKKSIDNFQNIFGPLFYSFVKNNVRYIMISSSLLLENVSHIDDYEEKKYIMNLKEKQKNFIIKKFEEIDDYKTNFLFIHDPLALKKMEEIISDSKLKKIDHYFVGHLHSKIFVKYFKITGKFFFHTRVGKLLSKITNLYGIVEKSINFFNSSYLFKKYNISVIPALGGLVGLDKGYGELIVYNDGKYDYIKHNL